MTPNQRKAAIAALAVAIAAPAEGLRQFAYYDPPGILTVCAGHTGKDVVKGRKYSLDECEAYLTADMSHAVDVVDKCQPGLPIEVHAAFADAVFNIGPRVACDPANSTAARMLSAKDYVGACHQLLRWNKARIAGVAVALPGLTKRREAEKQLCMEGV